MALSRCSIEADQGGIPHARARVSLVSWKGRSYALLFMVPLGLPSARPMAQGKRYGYHLSIINPRRACAERVTVVVLCVCVYVCLSVCLSVRTRYSGSTRN